MRAPFESPRSWALILAPILLWACDSDSPSRPQAEPLEIVLEVTGGLAGADFALRVDGQERVVKGVHCRSLCDFPPGGDLMGLSRAQLDELQALARDAGLPDSGDRDFGTGCCDLFTYELEYAEGDHRATIVGDDSTLPGPLVELAQRIQAMGGFTFPALVALGTERSDWPDDRLILHSAEVAGGLMDVDFTYTGGCNPHDVDLVAYGGFMESSPVQVRAALAHDARNDACDALIRRDLRFDLRALMEEYDEAYPGSPGGPLTLVLKHPGDGEDVSLTFTWRRTDG